MLITWTSGLPISGVCYLGKLMLSFQVKANTIPVAFSGKMVLCYRNEFDINVINEDCANLEQKENPSEVLIAGRNF